MAFLWIVLVICTISPTIAAHSRSSPGRDVVSLDIDHNGHIAPANPSHEPESGRIMRTQIEAHGQSISKWGSVGAKVRAESKGATARTGITMYLNGEHPIPSPRTVVDHLPREILYHMDIMNVNGTHFNGTHVYIPTGSTLRGRFVRSTHVIGSYEYGTVEQRWGENPMSVFPNIAIGAAERLRTLHHEGPWPETSWERVQEEQAKRQSKWWAFTDVRAKALNRARIWKQLAYQLQSKASFQMLNASTDPEHIAQLQEYVEKDDGQPSSFFQERKQLLTENLTKQASLAGEVSSAASNCYHLQRHAKLEVTSEGAFIPVNTKLVSFKGSMVFSPEQHVDFTAGITFFTYDAESGVLSSFLGGSSFGSVNEPEQVDASASFFVGPVDGESGVDTVGEDARILLIGPSKTTHWLYDLAHAFPIDYTYLYPEDEETLCPPEKFDELAKEAADLDLMDILKGDLSNWEDLTVPLHWQTVALTDHLVDVLDCGTTFLRGYPEKSNGVGFLETITWLHFLMEFPPDGRMKGVHGWTE